MPSLKKSQIPYGSIKELINDTQQNQMASIALFLFFCSAIMDSFFVRIIPDFEEVWYLIDGIENLILAVPIIISCKLLYNCKPLKVLPYYTAIFFVFLITYLMHPEYESWFIHPDYGIYNRFFLLKRGIFSLLIISLFRDQKKLLNALFIAAKICFLFYMMQYTMAAIRGYWEGVDYTGETIEAAYSLMFGYDMSFCAVSFASIAIFHKKKYYWILFIISAITIVTGGSRGALMCVASGIFLPFIVDWRNTLKASRMKIILLFIGIFIAAFLYIKWNDIVFFILNLLKNANIQSRTLEMLFSGTIMNDNGRSEISELAIGLIRTGGPWGNGVYGDRYVIGNTFYWGYSHNIFLEMYVSFGYLGGTIIFGILGYSILKFIITCRELEFKILFVIFASCSLRLLLSDSFWYNSFFWAMIGILLLSKKGKNYRQKMLRIINERK